MSVCQSKVEQVEPKMFDIQAVRNDFPILARELNGKSLVYLDSAATAQKPCQVIEALSHYYQYYNANIHRGIHQLAEEATEAYEKTRKNIAQFIGAKEAKEIIFTRNTTESINLVALSWGKQNIFAGDEILLNPLEHHSNLVPWQMLAQEKNAKLVFAKLNEDGQIDLDSFKSNLNSRTKLIAITQMSSVLGTIVPIKEITALAQEFGTKVLVDGAQSVPHLALDVQSLGCDWLAFSLHKMCGPTGVGILWGKADLLESMPPVYGGGSMISMVWKDKFTTSQIPWKFEAGTPNIADVIASNEAIAYIQKLGMASIRAHEIELTTYALNLLSELPFITIYGPKDPNLRGSVISFNIKGIHPHDLGQIVNEDAIAIRVGHHCCQPLMRELDIMGTARASFYIYNTKEEIDKLYLSLKNAHKVLGHVSHR